MKIPNEIKLKLFTKMLEMRLFEEKTSEIYRAGKIPGFIHLYIGEEAVGSGVCTALNKDDFVLSSHRGHCHCIGKGADLGKLMAEICGKTTGYCKGRGGTMHIFARDIGFLGTSGIVGGSIPMSLGPALYSKLNNKKHVTVCFFGDGASNQGTFHESLNLASLWKLPVIFVCENNLYATSVAARRSTSVEDISCRSVGYNMPGIKADGMDVIDVYSKTLESVQKARNGEGPSLIECKTYRFHGHYEGDPGTDYRKDEEVKEWKKKDPIDKIKKILMEEKIVDSKTLNNIEQKIKSDIEKAVDFALNSPDPKPEDALGEV